MATVSFRLDNPKQKDGTLKTAPVAVRVCLYISKFKRPEISTTLLIEPRHWHEDKERAKATLTNHTKFNLRLSDIERDIAEMWESNKDADRDQLKRLMQEYFRGRDWNLKPEEFEKKNAAPLVAYINEFIAKVRSGLIIRSEGTLQTYVAFLFHLQSYAAKTHIVLTFESITLEFYQGFMAYLYKQGHNDNTAGKQIKILKMFMNSSFEEELHTNLAFRKKKFRKTSSETDEVYLSESEISKIYSLDLSAEPQLSKFRDMFVFNCWVGVRFGDLCSIRPEQITQRLEGKLLRLTTEKTNEEVIIPFHPVAEAIYSHYNMRLPHLDKNENLNYNLALKDIAYRAGIRSKEQSRRFVKGKAKTEWLEKHKMVSAHTARRSFATNCYLMGIPILTIMAITGHRTEKAFLKYIRITKDQHAHIMLKHFNKSQGEGIMRKAN